MLHLRYRFSFRLCTNVHPAQRSYIWTRVCGFLWPFMVIIATLRAIAMIVQLNLGESKIVWECENGGQLWTASAAAGYANSSSFPDGICALGFDSLNTAFIVSLVVDIAFQACFRASPGTESRLTADGRYMLYFLTGASRSGWSTSSYERPVLQVRLRAQSLPSRKSNVTVPSPLSRPLTTHLTPLLCPDLFASDSIPADT